ncbi:MAG: spermidine synthase [Allosphingosinicella sp.]|uniref:spermidine synthase n=1 Tax=Allosphingosinicella sp. TaxID=2823234 RepID=UPI0039586A2C
MTHTVSLSPARERFARPLFIATIVMGSFLLFLTQPMIARMALPRLGGAPAVWNSAMLVYQLLLLGGYAYAHWLSRLRPRRQAGLHLMLFGLAALWLPIGIREVLPPVGGEPALWVPWFLLSSIGPLFFIVSAQAPLMQRWYALESSRGEPYTLYAASNLGSFAGLLSYPLLVEPLMTLEAQSWLWTGGYALLVLMVVGCALTIPAGAVEAVPEETAPPPTKARTLHWIALAAVPSGLMLSTTTHLTTDIVAMPLLWALPLGLYLLSFVVAFAGRRRPAELLTLFAPLIILIAGGLAFTDGSRNPFFSATLGLLLLFVVAVALHGEMFRLRPAVGHLTRFYLAMSFGGMLGGLFCAIVAPILFDWAYEHPILVVAAAFLVPQSALVPWPERWQRALRILLPLAAFALSWTVDGGRMPDLGGMGGMLGSIVISLLALACLGRPAAFAAGLAALMMSYGGWTTLAGGGTEYRVRSYFGVYSVSTRAGDNARVLTHGTTLHGLQNLDPDLAHQPTSYYSRRSGVGLALDNAENLFGPGANVGVVGLGTGTLACYARPDQNWRFFEIDPVMTRIARDHFTFLAGCKPDAELVLGDARLTLAAQPEGHFHLIAVDAFSSDAVPMHLLTREALQVYGRAMAPDGIVLFHISNRYLDLQPVIAANAEALGWDSAMLAFAPDADEEARNETVSVWIAMSRNPDTIDRLVELSGDERFQWQAIERRPGFAGWSDEFASILPLLKWPSLW